MNDEILGRAAQYRAYAQETQRIFAEAVTPLARKVRGTDSTKMVYVTLGSRNEFLRAEISEAWEQRIHASDLGMAVIEAAEDAEHSRSAADCDTVVNTGILSHLDSLRVEDFPTVPAVLPQQDSNVRGLSLDRIMSDVFSLSEAAKESREHAEVIGGSEGADGWVTVTLDPNGSIVDCTIGEQWAAGRSGAAISWALDDAAAHARQILTRGAGSADLSSQADQAIANAIAYLAELNQETGK
ncbi:hypothetical protein ACFWU5_04195 [Nocardia sp. NPDC058640]|uniref:hypothetical protein n=1 Tax=Nocardia sp. NPDC058640 TaxID=3346571 RepID=UPI0036636BB3